MNSTKNTGSTIGSQHVSMCKTKYDFVFYYEIDLQEIIDIRSKIIISEKHMRNDKIQRDLYSYSILDYIWMEEIEREIWMNNKRMDCRNTHDFQNVCFMSEGLFIHLPKKEMYEMVQLLAGHFSNACFICDESIANEGAIDIEKYVCNVKGEDMNDVCVLETIFLLKISEIKTRLSLITQIFVVPFVKKYYKILVLKFGNKLNSNYKYN